MFQKSGSGFSLSCSAKEVSHGIDDTGLDAIVTGNMSSTPGDDFKSFLLQAKKEAQIRTNGDTSSLSKAKGLKRKSKESLGEEISISSDVVITTSSIKVQPEKGIALHKAKHDHPYTGETQIMGEKASKIFVGTSSDAVIVSSCENNLAGGVQGFEAINPEKAYSLIVAYGLRLSELGKTAQEEFIKTKDELKEVKDYLKAEKEKMNFTIEYLDDFKVDLEMLKKKFMDELISRAEVEKKKNEKIQSLEKDAKVLSEELADAKKQVEGQDKEIYKLKIDGATKYLEGFDAALKQVKFLYPDINLSEVDSLKFVKDGKLVLM